jgi:hypothetical protein
METQHAAAEEKSHIQESETRAWEVILDTRKNEFAEDTMRLEEIISRMTEE